VGSTIPASLIVVRRSGDPFSSAATFHPFFFNVQPVMVDCIVDGFLIGSTVAASRRAGAILGLATCVEMGFLGIAVATRVNRCTGSSAVARTSALTGPPVLIVLASLLGTLLGNELRLHPVYFFAFISFGIVMLLYLVVNELLVEAREGVESHSEEDEAEGEGVQQQQQHQQQQEQESEESGGLEMSLTSERREELDEASGIAQRAKPDDSLIDVSRKNESSSCSTWTMAMAFFAGIYTVIVLDAVMKR
jgi:hypothetical protein